MPSDQSTGTGLIKVGKGSFCGTAMYPEAMPVLLQLVVISHKSQLLKVQVKFPEKTDNSMNLALEQKRPTTPSKG